MSAVSPVKQFSCPFNHLAPEVLSQIEEESELVRYELGARLLTPNLRSPGLLLLLQGEVRILATLSNQRSITLDRRGPGQMMGWVSLLRGESCELIQASEPCVCLLIPSDALVTAWRASEPFLQFFLERSTPSELSYVLLRALADLNAPPADEESWLRQAIARAKLHSGLA